MCFETCIMFCAGLVFVCEETAVDMYRGASDEEEDGMCV